MSGGGNWRDVVRRERGRFIEIAVPMVRAALVVVLFVLLEGGILGVMELVLVLPRPEPMRHRVEDVVNEIAFWSVIGVMVFYALYVTGEISRQFFRTMRGE